MTQWNWCNILPFPPPFCCATQPPTDFEMAFGFPPFPFEIINIQSLNLGRWKSNSSAIHWISYRFETLIFRLLAIDWMCATRLHCKRQRSNRIKFFVVYFQNYSNFIAKISKVRATLFSYLFEFFAIFFALIFRWLPADWMCAALSRCERQRWGGVWYLTMNCPSCCDFTIIFFLFFFFFDSDNATWKISALSSGFVNFFRDVIYGCWRRLNVHALLFDNRRS